ncbi:MAG TPA: hypothetical protein VFX40_06200 [Gemmatimonadaceae bacterium]|nr:hypothetical protein [Gemmatimonadaceae bacterium]
MTIPRQSDLPVPVQRGEIIVPSGEVATPDISVVSVVNVLLRYRYLIAFLALGIGGYMGLRSFTSGRSYTSTAVFMPKGARGQSQLGGLAAQFGINLGGDAQGSQLYTDMLKTKALLWPVAQQTYTVTRDSGTVSGDLIRIFNIKDPRPAARRQKVITRLQMAVKPTLNNKTGVINVNVTTGNPELSLQIARNVLDQVNAYNLRTRQEQAAAERGFVERQLAEKRAELRAAESVLASFLERNKMFRASPQLTLEYERLDREVNMRQNIYSSLSAAFEQARIEELRDLPVITVIEAPELPLEPNARGGVRKTLLGLIIGLVLGCILAFVLDRMARNRALQTDDFIEFAALRREAMTDLIHPWRPVARLFRRGRTA